MTQYVDIDELASTKGLAIILAYIFWPLFILLVFRIYDIYLETRNLKRNAQ